MLLRIIPPFLMKWDGKTDLEKKAESFGKLRLGNRNSNFHNLLPDLHSNPYQLLNQKCLLRELGVG
jgi:hypothetical protein